jgi:uncharacterized membrane protein
VGAETGGKKVEIGMLLLVVGLIVFFLVHLVPTQSELRSGLVQRMGLHGYKAAFSIASIIGLALIIIGYGKLQVMAGKNPQLWVPPIWTRHLAFVLMLPALVLLVAAYVPSRIRTAAKHPMLAAIKLWAASHLLANGELASLLLFGSFLAYAVYDRISLKHRPVLAPAAPRSGSIANDAFVVVAGVALYIFMLTVGHARLIGVPLLSGWM